MKTSGFNIEDTHLTDIDRIERLFAIITIAFTWAYLVGIYKDANIKPIRILKNGRRAQDSSSTPLMNDNQTSQEETWSSWLVSFTSANTLAALQPIDYQLECRKW